MKKAVKIICIIIAALALLGALGYGYFALCMEPHRGTTEDYEASLPLDTVLSADAAREDLTYFYKLLQSRHPKWLEAPDEVRAAVDARYEAELAELTGDTTVLQLWQAAEGVAALLHDGHTWVDYNSSETDLYISSFIQLHELGNPIAINGISTEELFERYKTLSSYETDEYARVRFFGNVVVYRPLLSLCGVDTSNGVTMTFETEEGEQDISYSFVPIEQVEGYSEPRESDWVSYSIDEEKSIGIFTLAECSYNPEYVAAVAEFFAEVDEKGIQSIIIDLRGNGGGSSRVANEFLRYLDVDEYMGWENDVRFGWYLRKNRDVVWHNQRAAESFEGSVYVLTDVYTYSAAMDFAMLIGDNGLGVLVGEASGNMPNSYGDCLDFRMPNSKLPISVSFKRWYRVDLSKNSEPLTPDYEVDGRDAMDKAYELIG